MSKSSRRKAKALRDTGRAKLMAAGVLPPSREPSGKIKRPTVAELVAIEKEQRLKETQIVRCQPHRRDLPNPGDDRASEPWGLFCIGYLDALPGGRDLALAGEQYKDQWRSWRLATGLPCPFGHSSDGVMTADDARDPDGLWRKIELAQSAMRDASKVGELVVTYMCGENRPAPHALWAKASVALRALAAHYRIGGARRIGSVMPRSMYYGPDPQVAE